MSAAVGELSRTVAGTKDRLGPLFDTLGNLPGIPGLGN